MTNRVMRIMVTCMFVLACCALAVAQASGGYLDAYIVKVKPDKRAQFDELAKKMAEANRANGGDSWLAMETVYGDSDTITFISTRKNYGDVENGMNSFMGAMNKAFGANVTKLFADWSQCIEWSRGELRQRRVDLSSNWPSSDADYAKLVGNGRYLRTTKVRVRPGRVQEFEALVKEVKMAREKAAPKEVQLVSQAVAGQEGTVFYVTTIQPNMGGFDSFTGIQKLLGDEGYQKWLKANAEIIETTRSTINRFMASQSAATPEVAAVAPEYWNPKPVVAAKKPAKKSAESGKGE